MTIEASVIVPVILMAVFISLAGLIVIYEKSIIYAEETEALFTIPEVYISNKKPEDYLNSLRYGTTLGYGQCKVQADYAGHKARFDGTLEYMESFEVASEREIDVRVDRLRRWQLYDNLSGKSGEQQLC